jgi:hypothetical protein
VAVAVLLLLVLLARVVLVVMVALVAHLPYPAHLSLTLAVVEVAVTLLTELAALVGAETEAKVEPLVAAQPTQVAVVVVLLLVLLVMVAPA